MKIVQRVHRKVLDDLKQLKEVEFPDAQHRKAEAAKAGDLRENEEFQSCKLEVENIASKIQEYEALKYSQVISETIYFNLIDVGCWFHLKGILKGDRLHGKNISNNQKTFYYDPISDETIFEEDILFGCPSDDYTAIGVYSTESELGKFLIGKPLGNYEMLNRKGERIKLELTALSKIPE